MKFKIILIFLLPIVLTLFLIIYFFNKNIIFKSDIDKNNNIITLFSLPTSYAEEVIVKLGEYSLGIKPLSAQAAEKKVINNEIYYRDTYPFVDVKYSTSSHRLKEDIILKEPGHQLEFIYNLSLVGLSNKKDKDHNLVFYSSNQPLSEFSKLFTFEAPYLIDANGKKTAPGEVSMEVDEQGLLSIKLDKNWLQTATYPIILDPTITIHIINLYSHPQVGDDWVVEFTTQGTADLKIIPDDQSTIVDDEFISLACGSEIRTPQILANDLIFYPNWQCNTTAKVIHLTKKLGIHTLRFEFGEQIAYAHNSPNREIFSIDFEEGDLSDFSETIILGRNNIQARSNEVQSGSYSMIYQVDDIDGSYVYGSKTFTTTDYLFLDFYVFIYREVRFSDDLTTDLLVSLTNNSNSPEEHEVAIGIRRNDMFDTRVNEFVINGRHISDYSSPTEYANNTWKHFTVEYKAGDGNGYVIVNIDNTEVLNEQNLSNVNNLVDRVNIGHLNDSVAYDIGSIIYFDSITGYDELVLTQEPTMDIKGVYNFQGQVNIGAQ